MIALRATVCMHFRRSCPPLLLALLLSLFHMLPRMVETFMVVHFAFLNLMHVPVLLALVFEMPFVRTVFFSHDLAPIST